MSYILETISKEERSFVLHYIANIKGIMPAKLPYAVKAARDLYRQTDQMLPPCPKAGRPPKGDKE